MMQSAKWEGGMCMWEGRIQGFRGIDCNRDSKLARHSKLQKKNDELQLYAPFYFILLTTSSIVSMIHYLPIDGKFDLNF